ncbi:MAG: hypothetical protein ACLQU4_00570 [Limisphaerales bacterium]
MKAEVLKNHGPPYPRNFFEKSEKHFPPFLSGMDWLTAGCNRKRANIQFSHFSDFMVLSDQLGFIFWSPQVEIDRNGSNWIVAQN